MDKSDEKYCQSRNCPPNRLACNGSTVCVDVAKFCNGINDCPDGSDESSTCSANKCPVLACMHACRPTPFGGVCYCPSGQMINPANNRSCIGKYTLIIINHKNHFRIKSFNFQV